MKVRFHPAARAGAQKRPRWYEERSPMSAAALAQEIDAAISQIAEAPMRYPVAQAGTRRLVLPRFPFSIFYRVGTTEIVIVSVAHHKRRPGYWRQRAETG